MNKGVRFSLGFIDDFNSHMRFCLEDLNEYIEVDEEKALMIMLEKMIISYDFVAKTSYNYNTPIKIIDSIFEEFEESALFQTYKKEYQIKCLKPSKFFECIECETKFNGLISENMHEPPSSFSLNPLSLIEFGKHLDIEYLNAQTETGEFESKILAPKKMLENSSSLLLAMLVMSTDKYVKKGEELTFISSSPFLF